MLLSLGTCLAQHPVGNSHSCCCLAALHCLSVEEAAGMGQVPVQGVHPFSSDCEGSINPTCWGREGGERSSSPANGGLQNYRIRILNTQ